MLTSLARSATKKHNKWLGVRISKPFALDKPARFKTDNRDKWEQATVIQVHVKPMRYVVTTSDGRSFRRNAKYILPSSSPGPGAISPDVPADVPMPNESSRSNQLESATTSSKQANKNSAQFNRRQRDGQSHVIKPAKRPDFSVNQCSYILFVSYGSKMLNCCNCIKVC